MLYNASVLHSRTYVKGSLLAIFIVGKSAYHAQDLSACKHVIVRKYTSVRKHASAGVSGFPWAQIQLNQEIKTRKLWNSASLYVDLIMPSCVIVCAWSYVRV